MWEELSSRNVKRENELRIIGTVISGFNCQQSMPAYATINEEEKKGVCIRSGAWQSWPRKSKIYSLIFRTKSIFPALCISAWIDTLLDIMWFVNFILVHLKNIPDQECSFSLLIILLSPQIKCDSEFFINMHSKSNFSH